MALRGWLRVYSLNNTKWDVEIHDADFIGTPPVSPNLKSGSKSGFTLDYKKTKNRLEALKPSSLTTAISLQNATDEALIDDMMQAVEGRFTVQVKKDDARYWTGIFVTDLIAVKEQALPYVVTLKAVCGLSILKNHKYVEDADISTITGANQYMPLIGVVNRCLTHLPTFGLFWSGGGTDYFTRWHLGLFAEGTFNDDGSSNYNINNAPTNHKLNQHAFYEVTGVLEFKIKNCFEVLKMVLQSFGLRLLQEDGEWRIIQVTLYAQDDLKHATASNASTLEASVTDAGGALNVPVKKELGTDYKIVNKQTRKYLPAYNEASVKYKGVEVVNWMDGFTSFGLVYQLLGVVTDGTVEGHKLRFHTAVNWSYSGVLSVFQATIKFSIKLVGVSQTYYLKGGSNNGAPIWTTDPNDYVETTFPDWGINEFYGGNTGGTTEEQHSSAFSVVSAPIPANGQIFIKAEFSTFTPVWGTAPTPGGFSQSLENPYMAFMPFGTDSGSADIFTATNDDVGFSLNDELPTMAFGDGPASSSDGAIHALLEPSFALDATTTWRSDAEGSYTDDGFSHALARVLVREYMGMTKQPAKLLQATITGNLSFFHKLVAGSESYVCLGAKLNAVKDEWSGEWFELRRDGLGIGVVDFDEDTQIDDASNPTITEPTTDPDVNTPPLVPDDPDVITYTAGVLQTGLRSSVSIDAPSTYGVQQTYEAGELLKLTRSDNSLPLTLELSQDLLPTDTTINFVAQTFVNHYGGDSKIKLAQVEAYDLLKKGPAEQVMTIVKNKETFTLMKGTPVYTVDSGTSGNIIGVKKADASDKAKMPASFILHTDLAADEECDAIISGKISQVDTSSFSNGDVVYVAAGGGYTNVKPRYPNIIQNLGVVGKVHATNGSGVVNGAGRANDVPNLKQNYIFHGDGVTGHSEHVKDDTVLTKTIKKRLTLSEYQNLGTTAIDILPAQGAKKLIVPVNVVVSVVRNSTETRRETMYFGHDASGITGNFYASVRDFMYTVGTNRLYTPRNITDTILLAHKGDNKPFKVFSSANFNGDLEVTILLTYQILDI